MYACLSQEATANRVELGCGENRSADIASAGGSETEIWSGQEMLVRNMYEVSKWVNVDVLLDMFAQRGEKRPELGPSLGRRTQIVVKSRTG